MKPVQLTPKEMSVIGSTDLCSLGTVSKNGWPHVVPVGYVFYRGEFYVASDEDAVKMDNVRRLPRATLMVDDEREECGVMLECDVEVLGTKAAERWRNYMRFEKGWGNDRSTAVIRLTPVRKASWFLKG